MSNQGNSQDNTVENIHIPTTIDAVSIDSMLDEYINCKGCTNPLRFPLNDPFARHFVHSAAIKRNLVSASQFSPSSEALTSGRGYLDDLSREVVIWKGREHEISKLRELLSSFANDSKEDVIKLPPMPPELRYCCRILSRDYGLVSISQDLGQHRHCVVFRSKDRKQIDEKLRSFASASSMPFSPQVPDGAPVNRFNTTTNKIEFPPMTPDLIKFAAITATDLGLHPVVRGIHDDRHLVVYNKPPTVEQNSNVSILLDLLSPGSTRQLDLTSELSVSDIKGALSQSNIPLILGNQAIKLAETSKNGKVSVDTLLHYMNAKEKQLHRVFEHFDYQNTGNIQISELENIFHALDLHPTSADYLLLKALVDHAQQHEHTNLTFADFKQICSLFDLHDLDALGTEVFVQTSSGFQQTSPREDSGNGLYTNIATSCSGGLANAFSRFCVAPFERVRLQLSVDPLKYKSTSDCFRSIFQQEGIQGLWRGNVLNMVRIIPQGAISFLTKDAIKELFPSSLRYSTLGLALSSMLSGIVCMSVVYPLDFIRGRMTTVPGLYKTWYGGMGQMYKEGGIRSLYEGVHYSNAWAAMYYGAQFFCYDMMKKHYLEYYKRKGQDIKVSPQTGLVLGAISGSISVVTAYPFELIRRKLQMQGVPGRPKVFNGFFDCYKKTVQEQGVRGLYRGLGANLMKTPLSTAITFSTYEFLMKDVFKTSTKL